MSDTRFDGKKIYKYANATVVYDIRGRYIYKAHRGDQPIFEISGNHIRRARTGRQAEDDIRGNFIHDPQRGTEPVYLIK